MICVSIGRTRHKMMIMECQMAQEAGAELIELRLDFLSRAIDLKRLLAVKKVPMIATIRRREDGGRWSKTEDERQMLMRLAIVGGFDWVDIETDIADKVKRFGKVKRVVSYHNPKEVPKNLEEIFEKMHHQDADVLKVAVKIDMPQDMWRVMRLMKHGKKPTIAIAMGDYGVPTRILGAKYGAPFTYAAFNKERGIAPGMFSFDEMKNIYHYDKINKDTKVYAVVGDPIIHSMSPIAHNAAFQHAGINAVYVPIQIPKDDFIDTLQMLAKVPVSGYSVTMPHKEMVHDFATERDDIVRACKAGNTLVPRSDGFYAYNTDYPAALSALRAAMADLESGDSVHGRQVLILGAGGTARTLAHGLHKEGALVIIANRSMEKALGLADEIGCRAVDWKARNAQNCEIIINCTPVGQHPDVDESPLHASVFRPGLTVMDCVYNPETTMMIREARDRGCKIVTGVEMFIRQAAEQFKHFTGQAAPVEAMLSAVRKVISPVSPQPGLPMKPPEIDDYEMEYTRSMTNLYLIGYRGTGKTTLAPRLAHALGYQCIEMDALIVQRAGMSIPDLFAQQGEARFRELESEVLRELSTGSKQVISTGGGIILREDNRELMRNTGTVIWLTAPFETINQRLQSDDGARPSLTKLPLRDEIARLLEQRSPWYAATAHYQVDTGTQNMDDSLASILHHLQRA